MSKKKIAILGSTGSIGKNLINILIKNKSDFNVKLLTTNKNYKEIIKQAKKLSVKNLIIADPNIYAIVKKKKIKDIKIYNNFDSLNKIFKTRLDYTMSSITGIAGLNPTYKIIKHTKSIAIANKESIICGWNILKKELKKNNTKFIPVDSEHFSIWKILKNHSPKNVDEIFITASGGPLLNLPINKINNVKLSRALKHPNWNMGKKISIDSATMMNKVFEVIEAKNIFDIKLNKIKILIHPSSYVHAIVKFNNGTSNLIAHDTTMTIPIYNSLYSNVEKKINNKKLNIKKLNRLNLHNLNQKRYPITKVLKKINNKISLFETIIVSTNDELVKLYIEDKIKFGDISKKLLKIVNLKEFNKYKKITPNSLENIIKLDEYVRLKIKTMSI
tara:strand:+ start:2026 stop:3189 length:1164 start_codon:yes stop_codon:yes gene_type:complete